MTTPKPRRRAKRKRQSLQEQAGLRYPPSEFAERVLHALLLLRDDFDRIGDAEMNFLNGVADFMGAQPPSLKQTEVVEQIARRHLGDRWKAAA